jgi:hypothetical protein
MNEQQTPVEIDDVEAHGLKEIAAGIVAAGAVTTGVAGAVHVNPLPGMRPPGAVEQIRDDATRTAGHATAAANTLAADATQTAGHASAAAHGIADPTVARVQATIASTLGAVDKIVADTMPNIDRTVESTARTATSTANSTVATARSTAASAETTALRTAASAEATALSVISTVQDLANHWTVNVGVLGASAKADGSLTNPGGTITLTDSTGGVLATADIHDGRATLSFVTAAGSGTLTLHYPGDGLWAPTQLPLHLPQMML